MKQLLRVAPAGKVFALAVPVQKGSHLAFSILPNAGTFRTRAVADAVRATYPPGERVTVILTEAPAAERRA